MPPAQARAASLTGSAAGSRTASAPAASGAAALLLARRHAHDPAPERPGHADGGQPDAAAGPQHQHATRPAARPGPVAQGEQAGAVALGERGGPRRVEDVGQRARPSRRHGDLAGEAAQAGRGQHPVPTASPRPRARRRHVPGHLAARHEGERRLDLVLPGDEEAVHEVDAGRLDGDHDLARARHRVGPLLHPQHRGRTELVQTTARTGRHATVDRWYDMPGADPRRARGPTSWCSCPRSRPAADTLFEPLGIGPLPGPGTVAEFAGGPRRPGGRRPAGRVCAASTPWTTGPTSSSSRSIPITGGRGIGRALLRAGCAWAAAHGYDELTLATYRDVPWNGPFYASEGFVEIGPGRRLAAWPTASHPRSPSCAASAPAS